MLQLNDVLARKILNTSELFYQPNQQIIIVISIYTAVKYIWNQ